MINDAKKNGNSKTNDALVIIGLVAIIIIAVDLVGYEIGQLIGATNVPIETFFLSAIVLFAFAFPLLRTYLEQRSLNNLTREEFAKQVDKLNLAEDSPFAAKGVYRFTLAVVIALILATAFYILATAKLDASVTDFFKTIVTVLTTALTTIIAFYFGSRAAEGGADGAADSKPTEPLTEGKNLLSTLEKLCDLDKIEDKESILDDLAAQYKKLSGIEKVDLLYDLQKSDKCKKKEIIESYKKKIDTKATIVEPPKPDSIKVQNNGNGRVTWCDLLRDGVGIFKWLRKHFNKSH
jgi:hypothetical protein